MHISAPFIRRPVATSLLSVAILLAGGVAFYFLPVAALPRAAGRVFAMHFQLLPRGRLGSTVDRGALIL